MFHKPSDDDITQEEIDKYLTPHREITNEFLEEFIMPEYIAFYIASGISYYALWEGSFSQHYNSAADLFNYFPNDNSVIINNVKKILRIKYSLEIIEETPLLKIKKLNLEEPIEK